MKLEQAILGPSSGSSAGMNGSSGSGVGIGSVAASGGLLVLPSVYSANGDRSVLMQESLYWRHYQRCRWLVDLAMRDVEQGCSVLPAVRVLQAYISSWPAGKEDGGEVGVAAVGVRLGLGVVEQKTTEGEGGGCMEVESSSTSTSSEPPTSAPSSLLPFTPTRGGVVTHLEESHTVLHKITAAVVCMKQQFTAAIRIIEIDSGAVVPMEIQEVFNEMMIGGKAVDVGGGDAQVQGLVSGAAVSRVGYKVPTSPPPHTKLSPPTSPLPSPLCILHQLIRCTLSHSSTPYTISHSPSTPCTLPYPLLSSLPLVLSLTLSSLSLTPCSLYPPPGPIGEAPGLLPHVRALHQPSGHPSSVHRSILARSGVSCVHPSRERCCHEFHDAHGHSQRSQCHAHTTRDVRIILVVVVVVCL